MRGEPEWWVEKAVESVKRSLDAGHVGEKGMYFMSWVSPAVGNLTLLMAIWNYRGCIPICTGWQ